jgi:hypothetical protein
MSEGFRIPDRHSDFKWPSFWITAKARDEVLSRYDSGEPLDDIVKDLEASDKMHRWAVEGVLYEARPQRLVAILVAPNHIEVGPLEPLKREKVSKWCARYMDPSFWVGPGGGFYMGESQTK